MTAFSTVLLAATISVGVAAPNVDQVQASSGVSASDGVSLQTNGDEIRRRVKEGQKVVVVEEHGRTLLGRVDNFGADALTLMVGQDRIPLNYDRILRIDRPHDGLREGALIGLTVGAGVGLLAAIDSAQEDGGWGGPDPGLVAAVAPLMFGALGAAVGTGVDALIRREPNLYRRQTGAHITLSRSERRIAITWAW